MSKLTFLSFHGSISRKPKTPKPTPQHHTYSKENQNPPNSRNINLQPNTEELKNIFNKFDADGDGKISINEYKKTLEVLGGGTKTGAAQAFRAADADGDGFIDLEEFRKVCGGDGSGAKSVEIKAAFRVFDADRDGKIKAEELMEVLGKMGEKCSLEGCKKMISGVDRDGDGLIDMDEFINMMAKTIKIL
ncbi:hypothetical protein DH2020_037577 [Rehmannia glutinosa]|uniref:EF-hand domain-containing protein n=1 Tax=Rehmannia glutinosa TaxID=99300 RepID=A0ABR0V0Z0_REHGL